MLKVQNCFFFRKANGIEIEMSEKILHHFDFENGRGRNSNQYN